VGIGWFLWLAVGTSTILISTGWAKTWVQATRFRRGSIILVLLAVMALCLLFGQASQAVLLGCLAAAALFILCTERSLPRIALTLSGIVIVVAVQLVLAMALPYEFVSFFPRMRTSYLYPVAISLTAMAITWSPRLTVVVTICGIVLWAFISDMEPFRGSRNLTVDTGTALTLIFWAMLCSVATYTTVVHAKRAFCSICCKMGLTHRSHEGRPIG